VTVTQVLREFTGQEGAAEWPTPMCKPQYKMDRYRKAFTLLHKVLSLAGKLGPCQVADNAAAKASPRNDISMLLECLKLVYTSTFRCTTYTPLCDKEKVKDGQGSIHDSCGEWDNQLAYCYCQPPPRRPLSFDTTSHVAWERNHHRILGLTVIMSCQPLSLILPNRTP
jgi:hypothetical protein